MWNSGSHLQGFGFELGSLRVSPVSPAVICLGEPVYLNCPWWVCVQPAIDHYPIQGVAQLCPLCPILPGIGSTRPCLGSIDGNTFCKSYIYEVNYFERTEVRLMQQYRVPPALVRSPAYSGGCTALCSEKHDTGTAETGESPTEANSLFQEAKQKMIFSVFPGLIIT